MPLLRGLMASAFVHMGMIQEVQRKMMFQLELKNFNAIEEYEHERFKLEQQRYYCCLCLR